MKRIFTFITSIALSLLMLNSCDLDMKGTYTIFHKAQCELDQSYTTEEAESISNALKDMFDAIPGFNEKHTFTGSYNDAAMMAEGLFLEMYKQIDEETVLSIIGEKDNVVYSIWLNGNGFNTPLNYVVWFHEQPEDQPIL